MANTLEEQKQWEARNSDRRDSFEGVKYGVRTGEVRSIAYQVTPIRTQWTPAAQEGTNGSLSDDPVAMRHVHVWPSDVHPPEEGAMVFAGSLQVTDFGTLGMNGNGWTDEADGHGEPEEVWSLPVYVPAADGD